MAKITRKATEKKFETKFYISRDWMGGRAFLSLQKPVNLDGIYVMGGTLTDYDQMYELSRDMEELLLGGEYLGKGLLAEVTIKGTLTRTNAKGKLVDENGNEV